ncbi:MAG: hypothetical protein EBZ69_01445 [Alphaproteobacteria bacterium]|nr:hypothetical protein [Alphaproteobacteria bacterium]
MRFDLEKKSRVLELLKEGKAKEDIMSESGLSWSQIAGIQRREKDRVKSVPIIDENLATSFADAVRTTDGDADRSTTKTAAIIKPTEMEEPKEGVIARIAVQVDTFEPLLGAVIGEDKQAFLKSLHKRTTIELTALEKVVLDTVKIGNLTNQLRHIYYMFCSGLEVGTAALGLKSSGYTKVMMSQDKEVRMILQELALQYKDRLQVSVKPEIRLAMLSVTTLMATDARNRLAPATGEAPRFSQEYSDL